MNRFYCPDLMYFFLITDRRLSAVFYVFEPLCDRIYRITDHRL